VVSCYVGTDGYDPLIAIAAHSVTSTWFCRRRCLDDIMRWWNQRLEIQLGIPVVATYGKVSQRVAEVNYAISRYLLGADRMIDDVDEGFGEIRRLQCAFGQQRIFECCSSLGGTYNLPKWICFHPCSNAETTQSTALYMISGVKPIYSCKRILSVQDVAGRSIVTVDGWLSLENI